MSLFTVLGSTGFIGRNLVRHLRDAGHEVGTPPRDVSDLRGADLGHVVYCIGMTGNFRKHPRGAVDAHVGALFRLMEGAAFESWLYLSSTRVYGGLPEGVAAVEDMPLPVVPSADSLYDLSKLLGEAACLGLGNDRVRVARVSNVYGPDQDESTFLGSIFRDIGKGRKVVIGEDARSAKDYISVEDVCFYLKEIALGGKCRLYNVASGRSVSHQEIVDTVRASGFEIAFAENGPCRRFPDIGVRRLFEEFGTPKHELLKDIPRIVSGADNDRKWRCS